MNINIRSDHVRTYSSRENMTWGFIALNLVLQWASSSGVLLGPLVNKIIHSNIFCFFILNGYPAIPKQGSFPLRVQSNRVHLYQYFWSAFSSTFYPGYKDLTLKTCLPATEATPAF